MECHLIKSLKKKISGETGESLALKNMLSFCREDGHKYVYSIDRLARNLRDLLDLVKEITDKGCIIHFVQQHLEFSNDEKHPTPKLMHQVIVGGPSLKIHFSDLESWNGFLLLKIDEFINQ